MKKIVSVLMAAAMAMSILTVPSFAGNTSDSGYWVDESIGYVHPAPREKQDSTSVYVNLVDGTSTVWQVDVLGLMGQPDTWLDIPKCNDGLGTRSVSIGTRYFLYNNVYESHFTHASLEFHSTGYAELEILWSPDSVW